MNSKVVCEKHNKAKEAICGSCKNCEPMCTVCFLEHVLAFHGVSLIPLSEVVNKKITEFQQANTNDGKILDEAISKILNIIKEINNENEKCKISMNILFKELIDMKNKIFFQYNQIMQNLLVNLSKITREKFIQANVGGRMETEIKRLISCKNFVDANELLESAMKNKACVDVTEIENLIKNDTMKAKEFDLSKLELRFPSLSSENLRKLENERDSYKKERDDYCKEIQNLRNMLETERWKLKKDLENKMTECIFFSNL